MPIDFEACIVRLFYISTVLVLVYTLIINMDGSASGVLAMHEVPYGTRSHGFDRCGSCPRRRRNILIHEQMIIVVGNANALLSHSALRCHTGSCLLCINDRVRVRKDQMLRILLAHLRRRCFDTILHCATPLLALHVA